MTGPLRIVIYGGLFAAALLSPKHSPPYGDSPLHAPEVIAHSPKLFYKPEGLLAFFKQPSLKLLKFIRACVTIAWIFCILGFGGHLPVLVTGIGAFYLHGMLAGALGTNHRWVVPIYTLLALCFAEMNQSYSLDAFFSRFSWYPFKPYSNELLSSGFGRNLAFLVAIFTLFSGGVAKLFNAGWRWMDGWTIHFCVSRPGVGFWPAMKKFFTDHPKACMWLAIATLVIELGAPIALFYEPSRLWIILAAIGLHVGIFLTMNPNYFPQSLCYLLGLSCIGSTARLPPPVHLDAALFIACGLATCFFILLLITTFFRIEWYPLTYIPMYSAYRGPGGAWSHYHIRDEEQCEALGREFIHMKVPYPLTWAEKWIFVRSIAPDGSHTECIPQGITAKHWRRLMHRVAAEIFACKEKENPWFFKEKQEIVECCSYFHQHEKKHLEGPIKYQLVCRLKGEEKILAAFEND